MKKIAKAKLERYSTNMSAYSYYLTEALGIKKYLCPPEIYAFRKLSGPLPCDTLVLTEGRPDTKALQLLKKIMKAIETPDFSLMEISDLSRIPLIRHFLLSEKPAKKILIFSTKLSNLFVDSPSLLTCCNLEDLLTGSTAENKKRELWNRLKQWK